MNVVITEKNKPGEIRMNVDATPINGGIRRTKFHVRTPQEVRHDLVGAAVFTEMDMRMGFHQLPVTEKTRTRSVFQTYEGLHGIKRLYFGPTSSNGIFHHKVEKVFKGIPGCTTIHDNQSVFFAVPPARDMFRIGVI